METIKMQLLNFIEYFEMVLDEIWSFNFEVFVN